MHVFQDVYFFIIIYILDDYSKCGTVSAKIASRTIKRIVFEFRMVNAVGFLFSLCVNGLCSSTVPTLRDPISRGVQNLHNFR